MFGYGFDGGSDSRFQLVWVGRRFGRWIVLWDGFVLLVLNLIRRPLPGWKVAEGAFVVKGAAAKAVHHATRLVGWRRGLQEGKAVEGDFGVVGVKEEAVFLGYDDQGA